MNSPLMKVCRSCDGRLPLEDFPKAKGCKDGRRNQCKTCRNAYEADYVRRRLAADPDFRARRQAYRKAYGQRLARTLRLARNAAKLARYKRHRARWDRNYRLRRLAV